VWEGSGGIKCNIRTRHRCRCPLGAPLPSGLPLHAAHSCRTLGCLQVSGISGKRRRRRASETRNVVMLSRA